jgi:subtilisin-like proprotein convertase family protein
MFVNVHQHGGDDVTNVSNLLNMFSSGENPRGSWKLKLIDNPLNEIGDRVVNGFGTLHLDTSKQDTDVEDLEEQVIDDQTKQQASKIQNIKINVSFVSIKAK